MGCTGTPAVTESSPTALPPRSPTSTRRDSGARSAPSMASARKYSPKVPLTTSLCASKMGARSSKSSTRAGRTSSGGLGLGSRYSARAPSTASGVRTQPSACSGAPAPLARLYSASPAAAGATTSRCSTSGRGCSACTSRLRASATAPAAPPSALSDTAAQHSSAVLPGAKSASSTSSCTSPMTAGASSPGKAEATHTSPSSPPYSDTATLQAHSSSSTPLGTPASNRKAGAAASRSAEMAARSAGVAARSSTAMARARGRDGRAR